MLFSQVNFIKQRTVQSNNWEKNLERQTYPIKKKKLIVARWLYAYHYWHQAWELTWQELQGVNPHGVPINTWWLGQGSMSGVLWSKPRGAVRVYLLHSLLNHILKRFLYEISASRLLSDKLFLQSVSTTLDSIKHKYKTNFESSVLYASMFSSRKGLFCKGLFYSLFLTLKFKDSELWKHTHTLLLYFILPPGCVFIYLIDSQSRADIHKCHLSLTYN